MNQVKALITAVETAGDISLVSMQAAGESFASLVIDTPATAAYLQAGKEIIMVFKETEMAIGKNLSGGLSLRNHFPAKVRHIQQGRILACVDLDFKGISLQAVITSRSVADLQLTIGDEVTGLVKTNEISLTENFL